MSQRVRAGGSSWLPLPGVAEGAGWHMPAGALAGTRQLARTGARARGASRIAGLSLSRRRTWRTHARGQPPWRTSSCRRLGGFGRLAEQPLGVQVPAPRVAVAWYDERRQEP